MAKQIGLFNEHDWVYAMIHSKDAKGRITIWDKVGDNDYIVRTEDGVACHAIFNPFVGCYYADDKYAVVKE